MHCSCPDWAVPCKHLAAVIYMIAHEIDKDPFLVFHLHGLDLLAELEKENPQSNKIEAFNLPDIKNFLRKSSIKEKTGFNEEKYNKLDFSIIAESRENIIKLLEPSPLFFPKDFREILSKAYKITSRKITKQEPEPVRDNVKSLSPLPENIILNVSDLSVISPTINELADRLETIPLKEVPGHNINFITIHTLWNFSRHLVEKSSAIPRLIKVDAGYLIQWVPAVNILAVKNIFEMLMDIFPASILEIQAEGKNAGTLFFKTKKEEFLAITGIFIQHYIGKFVTDKVEAKIYSI